MALTDFDRPPTTQIAVLAELRTWILTGRLRPGDQVRAEAVGRELGVSRVPVREALHILEGEGQVSYAPHQGYFVTELDIGDLLEVYRIRELLEEEAIRAAVPQMAAEDFDRMEAALEEMERAHAADDIISHTTANRQFHFAVFDAGGRPHLVRIIRMLWDWTDPYRSIYYNDPANRDRVAEEHRTVLDAVRGGDVEGAVATLNTHRKHAIEALEAVLAAEPTEP